MPITFSNTSGTGNFVLANNTNSGNIVMSVSASTPAPPVSDPIRAALQPAFTASYDAAAVGSFISINSASYNNVTGALDGATLYGLTTAQMNGANGSGTAWGAPFAFAFTASIIPSGSYIIAYSTVMRSAVSQSLAVYYTTSSNATSSAAIGERIAPANNFVSTGTDTRYFFVRKAPTDNLPANSTLYLWSTGSLTIKGPNIARIPYKSVNGPAPQQITGSWLSWNTANTGQPAHQFVATTTKSW